MLLIGVEEKIRFANCIHRLVMGKEVDFLTYEKEFK